MNLTAEQIETLRKGLRDWEKPENRYAALNLLDSLGASPVQAEPVAWEAALIKDGKKILRYLSKNKPTERDFSEAMLEIGNVEVTPLYAHPPSGRDAEDAAIWKAVEGFERIYEVSSDGRVRSLDRVDSDNNQRKGTELNPNPDANGYKRVSLWRDGKVTHKTVHRLVATAFCDKPDGCEEVNHIDGDKANNVAENLEWVSSSYNTLHAARVLKVMQNRPVKGTFVSDGTVVTFDSLAEAEEAGFTRSLIHKCIIGKRTHHKGYAWEYVDAAIDAAMSAEGCRG